MNSRNKPGNSLIDSGLSTREDHEEHEIESIKDLPREVRNLILEYKEALPQSLIDDLVEIKKEDSREESNNSYDNLLGQKDMEERLKKRAINLYGRFESEEEIEQRLKEVSVESSQLFKRSLKSFLNSVFTKKPRRPVKASDKFIETNSYNSHFLARLYKEYTSKESVTLEDLRNFIRNLLETLWNNRDNPENPTSFRGQISDQFDISTLEERIAKRAKSNEEEMSELQTELEDIENKLKHPVKSDRQKEKQNELNRRKEEIKDRIREIKNEKPSEISDKARLEKQKEDEEQWLMSLGYELQRMTPEETAIALLEMLEFETRNNEELQTLVKAYLVDEINEWAKEHEGEEPMKEKLHVSTEEWSTDDEKTQSLVEHAKELIRSFCRRKDNRKWKESIGEDTLSELNNALNILSKKIEEQ